MPNTPSSEVVKESLRKAIASVCIGYKKYSPKDRTSEKPVFLDPLSVDLIADELESFLLAAIESARLEGKKEENTAWMEGARCDVCGGAKKEDLLWGSCEDCS